MTRIIVEIDNAKKAASLKEMLDEMSFVKKTTYVKTSRDIIDALQEQQVLKGAMVKRKNPAILKYL
jgi:tRNA C32,U32 (ribose-2'-O)-methylase TrmJ